MTERTCGRPDCAKQHRARGLCAYHWRLEYGKGRTRYPIACLVCGREWMSSRPDGKFCSDSCKSSAYSLTPPDERGNYRTFSRSTAVVLSESAWCALPTDHLVVRLAAHMASRPDHPRIGNGGLFAAGLCAWCSTPFVTWTTKSARYCSERCISRASNSRHDLARGRFNISRRVRLMVYERDEWVCQLCLEDVDPDLWLNDPSNDWAPSLDHIECQSWTDEPDHSPSNLRLAHRWCNAVRSDGRYYSEADLRLAC